MWYACVHVQFHEHRQELGQPAGDGEPAPLAGKVAAQGAAAGNAAKGQAVQILKSQSSIVARYSKYTRALTFKNLYKHARALPEQKAQLAHIFSVLALCILQTGVPSAAQSRGRQGEPRQLGRDIPVWHSTDRQQRRGQATRGRGSGSTPRASHAAGE